MNKKTRLNFTSVRFCVNSFATSPAWQEIKDCFFPDSSIARVTEKTILLWSPNVAYLKENWYQFVNWKKNASNYLMWFHRYLQQQGEEAVLRYWWDFGFSFRRKWCWYSISRPDSDIFDSDGEWEYDMENIKHCINSENVNEKLITFFELIIPDQFLGRFSLRMIYGS